MENAKRMLGETYDDPAAPGACAAVVEHGRIVLAECAGRTRTDAEGEAITPRTNFRLASMTKQFTAAAVLILRDRGKLALEDAVTRHVPSLPGWAAGMTLRHLLTHTSGVPAYEALLPPGLEKPVVDAEVPALLAAAPGPDFAPGTRFFYSNTGYALLALAVEQVSGTSYPDFLKGAIFAPLGMDATLAFVAGGPAVERRAYGHKRGPGGVGWIPADQSLTSSVLGDGGVYSSVEDYARWDAALYGKAEGPLSPATIAEAFAPARLADGAPVEYGLGWRLETVNDRPVIYHTGKTTGFNTCVRRVPSCGFTVIALSNREGQDTHRITRDAVEVL